MEKYIYPFYGSTYVYVHGAAPAATITLYSVVDVLKFGYVRW